MVVLIPSRMNNKAYTTINVITIGYYPISNIQMTMFVTSTD